MRNNLCIASLFVAAIAAGGIFAARDRPVLQYLAAIPFLSGLLTALGEVIKMEWERQNRAKETASQNAFVLSAASHMSQVAFDKHVQFCEKYVAAVNSGLRAMMEEGPGPQASKLGGTLVNIRLEYVLWQTSDVVSFLHRFEKVLIEIGATDHMLRSYPAGDHRTKMVEEVFKKFSAVFGLGKIPEGATEDVVAENIINKLRDHLGISDLTRLRKHYLDEAVRRSGKS